MSSLSIQLLSPVKLVSCVNQKRNMHIFNWKQFRIKISVGFVLRGQLGVDFFTGRRVMKFWIELFQDHKIVQKVFGINPSSVPFRVNTRKCFAPLHNFVTWVKNMSCLFGYIWMSVDLLHLYSFCIFGMYAPYKIDWPILEFWMSVWH